MLQHVSEILDRKKEATGPGKVDMGWAKTTTIYAT